MPRLIHPLSKCAAAVVGAAAVSHLAGCSAVGPATSALGGLVGGGGSPNAGTAASNVAQDAQLVGQLSGGARGGAVGSLAGTLGGQLVRTGMQAAPDNRAAGAVASDGK